MLAIGNLGLYAHPLILGEGLKNPNHVELLFSLRIMDRGNVDAIIELVFIPEHLQDGGNERAIDFQIVLAEVGECLKS